MTSGTQLLRISEVATITRASEDTIRYWIKMRKLPSVKPGRFRLIEEVELSRFLRRNAQGYEVDQ